MTRNLASLAALLACTLAACGEDAPADARAISSSEAQALDEAAEMLEERRLPDDAFAEENGDGDGEQAGPSQQESQP